MSDRHVRIARHAVARGSGRLLAIGLGSCVAIALYDGQSQVGGLAHVLLPDPDSARDGGNPARFASTAVPMLVAEMRAMGARGTITGRLAGGAALFGALRERPGGAVGPRNVAAARTALAAAGIAIVGEEIGGSTGRTVTFDIKTGALTVRSVSGGERAL